MALKATLQAIRGPISWGYFYILLGFAISIEGTIIQMTPLRFPWNILLFLTIGCTTGYLILGNGWCQDKLVGLKERIENTPR
jgi:hypothetical protein